MMLSDSSEDSYPDVHAPTVGPEKFTKLTEFESRHFIPLNYHQKVVRIPSIGSRKRIGNISRPNE
jgi:hypothetical protein